MCDFAVVCGKSDLAESLEGGNLGWSMENGAGVSVGGGLEVSCLETFHPAGTLSYACGEGGVWKPSRFSAQCQSKSTPPTPHRSSPLLLFQKRVGSWQRLSQAPVQLSAKPLLSGETAAR